MEVWLMIRVGGGWGRREGEGAPTNSAMAAMSSSDREKSKMAAFSGMRDGVTLLGMT